MAEEQKYDHDSINELLSWASRMNMKNGEIVICKSEDGHIKVDVLF